MDSEDWCLCGSDGTTMRDGLATHTHTSKAGCGHSSELPLLSASPYFNVAVFWERKANLKLWLALASPQNQMQSPQEKQQMCFQKHISGALCCLTLTVAEDAGTVAALPGAIWTHCIAFQGSTHQMPTPISRTMTPRVSRHANASENLG